MGRRCEVTIRRPDGQIETVVHPKIDHMTPQMWEMMKDAMRKAGRGECLSYNNIIEETDSDRDLRAVGDLMRAADRCKDSDYGRYLRLREQAAKAREEWAVKYPEHAARLAGMDAKDAQARRAYYGHDDAASRAAENMD